MHSRPTSLAPLAGALTLVLAACADTTAPAPAATPRLASSNATVSESNVPVHNPIQVPCGRMGLEIVPLDGVEHVTFQESFGRNGGHVRFHVNAHNVSGYGLVSGDYYHAEGTTQEDYDFDVGQFPFSYATNYTFGVQGNGNYGHIVAHEVLMINYDPYGNRTVQVAKFDAECKS